MELTGVALSTAHRDLVALETLLPVYCEEIHQAPWPNPKKVLTLMPHVRRVDTQEAA